MGQLMSAIACCAAHAAQPPPWFKQIDHLLGLLQEREGDAIAIQQLVQDLQAAKENAVREKVGRRTRNVGTWAAVQKLAEPWPYVGCCLGSKSFVWSRLPTGKFGTSPLDELNTASCDASTYGIHTQAALRTLSLTPRPHTRHAGARKRCRGTCR